ncbi:MAG: GAF domain-containing protein [Bacteroidaceae bacterium]|nr:GAF domain-containing protein [Bacteroidaceae bacterium]
MNNTEKINRYQAFLPELEAILKGETDMIVKMSVFAALLHEEMNFFWTGFYRVVSGELLLGPFQGTIACTHIGRGKGVCGTAWQRAETIVVKDVELFNGHIACSSLSKSEIVVPIKNKLGEIIAVLDIDSTEIGTFDDTDKYYLEQAVTFL